MFLFKVVVLVALVSAPALAGATKGFEQQREEQTREEPASQQQLLVKVEETGDRKLAGARPESKGGDEKKPLEVIKIEQEIRPQQQIEEHESVKAEPAGEQVVVREDTKRATFAPPILQQQQQREETAQLEEPRGEQVQIKQELELPQKQEEIKGAEIRQLDSVKRQPEVLLRSSVDVARVRSSWATKDSFDRRPLSSEHREEPSRPLAPVKTYAKAYNQEAPKMYTLGRLFGGGNSQYQDQSSYYQPSYYQSPYYQPYYSSQSYGYPYYQSQPSYGYSQPSYGYPYYRGQSSTVGYTTGGTYTRYAPQAGGASYLYPAQRQPVYVREYYLPASTSTYYQAPSSYPSSASSSYRLHYSEPIKSRRTSGLSVDEHTSIAEE